MAPMDQDNNRLFDEEFDWWDLGDKSLTHVKDD